MALTPEEKTQKQIDTAVKAAVRRERATVKSVIDRVQSIFKDDGDKAAQKVLKNFAIDLKAAQAASDAPVN